MSCLLFVFLVAGVHPFQPRPVRLKNPSPIGQHDASANLVSGPLFYGVHHVFTSCLAERCSEVQD